MDIHKNIICPTNQLANVKVTRVGSLNSFAGGWRGSSSKTDSAVLTAQRELERGYALAAVERDNLPRFTGSDKQINWALLARHRLLRAAYEELVQTGEIGDKEFEDTILTPARLVDRASWWIDNRDTDVNGLAELLADSGESAGISNENPF